MAKKQRTNTYPFLVLLQAKPFLRPNNDVDIHLRKVWAKAFLFFFSSVSHSRSVFSLIVFYMRLDLASILLCTHILFFFLIFLSLFFCLFVSWSLFFKFFLTYILCHVNVHCVHVKRWILLRLFFFSFFLLLNLVTF